MLTTKKRNFAEHWMSGNNKTQSAIKAGYSAASAKYKGHELSKDKDVLEYIERIKAMNPAPAPAPVPQPIIPQPADVPEEVSEDPPVPKLVTSKKIKDPLVVLEMIMNQHLYTDPKLAMDAAAKLAPYVSAKVGETGKKEAKNMAAKKAAGAFSAMTPPKIVVNNVI